ncbi:DNA recombination protein RmuC [Planctomycetales bacterium ZRK34]|nr:DNA recombination protein RmuC [Planctomycetales bacterium ZRK34]
MTTAFIITAIIALGALGAALWFYKDRQAIARDRDQLEQANESHLAKLDAQQSELAELKTQLTVATEKQAAIREQFEAAQQQARETFESLANKTLRQTVDDFHKQAEKLFKAEQEKSTTALDSMIKPVRETLTEYQKKLLEAEQLRAKAYGSLSEQAKHIADSHKDLRDETAKLVRALRRPEVRGRWGELQMKRLFELAGMTEHVDFEEQTTVEGEDGSTLRPDFTIRLPNDRVIVIDVKTPIDAYLDATDAVDESQREHHLERHARQVRQKADQLASKAYWDKCDGSPEFVVMFMPGESMLYAAVQRDADLIERAMQKQVIIATPTVVMALLKTVAMGWREKSLEENAKQIAALGRELHERLATVLEHVDKLGARLGSAVKQYNQLVGSVDARLVPTATKFKELKADSPKALPESLEPIVQVPREIQSAPVREVETDA